MNSPPPFRFLCQPFFLYPGSFGLEILGRRTKKFSCEVRRHGEEKKLIKNLLLFAPPSLSDGFFCHTYFLFDEQQLFLFVHVKRGEVVKGDEISLYMGVHDRSSEILQVDYSLTPVPLLFASYFRIFGGKK